jgi:hypothetical protein
MKITLESTDRLVEVRQDGAAQPIQARVWQGTTEGGIPIVCLVARIAVPAGHDQSQFQRELQEHAAPNRDAVDAFPLRMLI